MHLIWKDIEGYEGLYQVSNVGSIYSVRYKRFRKSKTDKYGYSVVGLNKDGNIRWFFVHRLVASAFIQNPRNLPVVNHLDGNKQNNCMDNLEWCDHSANVKHAYKSGLIPSNTKGQQKVIQNLVELNAKLSKEIAQRIRNEYKEGVRGCGFKSLAKKYGVCNTTIKSIIKNRTYKE